MARREDQPQQVIAHVIVGGRFDLRGRLFLLRFEIAPELAMFAVEHLAAPQPIDGAMLRGRHEPRRRIVGNAGRRPLLERGDERVLRKLFGQTDVAHHPREAGDELR